MSGVINITKLRNVTSLKFEVPGPGVWLLTGANGSGKSTLLACIKRIMDPTAFQDHFPASAKSKHLDSSANAEVSYTVDGKTVTYKRGDKRWSPVPKSLSGNLKNFGYSGLIFIGANADRVSPKPQDFEPKKLLKVSDFIRDNANKIFGTKKFSSLHQVNVTRGDNKAYVLRVGNSSPYDYVSEKSLSLGELCVLKLLRKLDGSKNNALVLVDELEMALHPQAQIGLLRLLDETAKSKQHTIIFSTHSATIIKSVRASQIIHLDWDGASQSVVRGCFASYVLGATAGSEERGADIHLLCEDDMAEAMLSEAISIYFQRKGADFCNAPTIEVTPVGDFKNVLRLLEAHLKISPSGRRIYAVLDKDVETDTLEGWKKTPENAHYQRFLKLSEFVRFFSVTPECGIVECAESAAKEWNAAFKEVTKSHTANLVIPHDVPSKENRDACKSFTKKLIKDTADATSLDPLRVRAAVCAASAQMLYKNKEAEMTALVGTLIAS